MSRIDREARTIRWTENCTLHSTLTLSHVIIHSLISTSPCPYPFTNDDPHLIFVPRSNGHDSSFLRERETHPVGILTPLKLWDLGLKNFLRARGYRERGRSECFRFCGFLLRQRNPPSQPERVLFCILYGLKTRPGFLVPSYWTILLIHFPLFGHSSFRDLVFSCSDLAFRFYVLLARRDGVLNIVITLYRFLSPFLYSSFKIFTRGL